MSTLLCHTKNGFAVYVDLEGSHFTTHLAETPQLKDLVIEVLQNYEFTKEKIRFEANLGRAIGVSALVGTTSSDEIVYAKRPFRNTRIPFVKNREPAETNYVTIDLEKIDNKTCRLFTAYVGRITPPIPGEVDANDESIPFWNSHALCWGTEEIVPGTETAVRPW